MVHSAESHGTSESLRNSAALSPEEPRMSQSPEQPDMPGGPGKPGGMDRLERINHWIRVILGIVIVTVFIVGMIAYYFTYR